MKIIVDADATPRQVLEICKKAAGEKGIELLTVASFDHRVDWPGHIITEPGPDSTDLMVINLSVRGDVVVTQDWGLAAVVISRGARAISPSGMIYKEENMDFLLEERNIKARFRRGGGRTRGPSKRTAGDDSRFKNNLFLLLNNVLE